MEVNEISKTKTLEENQIVGSWKHQEMEQTYSKTYKEKKKKQFTAIRNSKG